MITLWRISVSTAGARSQIEKWNLFVFKVSPGLRQASVARTNCYRMIKRGVVLGLLVAGILAGCSDRDTPPTSAHSTPERRDGSTAPPQASTGAPAIDACKLLSNEEIASVQGEAPARSDLVGVPEGDLSVSQCNFLLPGGVNSMALRVVERGKGPQPREPKDVWQETFYGAEAKAAATERKARKAQKVEGVGEDAFWLGDVKRGGLHVLSGNRYIKISVGGKEDLETKIAKCSKLSEFVLPRLGAEN